MAQYELVNSKMIRANVQPGEQIMLRRGSMLAYKGQVTFEPTMGTSGGVMPTGGMGGMGGMGGGTGTRPGRDDD